MPFRPEGTLKCPELKGEFKCGDCDKVFCHAASMRRHRANFHGDTLQCLICNSGISSDVRRHMSTEHDIDRVFTCICCKWSFRTKKELMSHNKSMSNAGVPGDAVAIAVSNQKPDQNTIPEKPATEDDELASFLVDLMATNGQNSLSLDTILGTFMKEIAGSVEQRKTEDDKILRDESESGIESASTSSPETSPSTSIDQTQTTQRTHKRRSISDIYSALVLKKCK